MPSVKRSDPPTRRVRNSRETRRRIRQAARELFLAQGFSRTTIAEIADRADVAVQTVYAVFKNKRSIFKEVVDVAIVGDDQPVAVAEREAFGAILFAETPEVMIERFTLFATSLLTRTADVFEMAYSAASSDEVIAEMAREGDLGRLRNMQRIAGALARKGFLRPGVTKAHAADTMWSLASPAMYRMLVVDRDWSTEQYRDWLLTTLVATFLEASEHREAPPHP